MSEGDQPLTIDVVSDVVCPWCYLGKRRLALALAEADGGPIAVRWRPYQLDPTIPADGMDRRAYLRNKFGDVSRLDEIHARLTALGAEVGVAYHFDAISRAPNTLDAHRLIRWALAADAQDRIVERLFQLYFEQGRDIGERALLVEVARECGMDGEVVAKLLADGHDGEAVQAEIAQAQSIGVTGVPFFIFASRLAVPGAQSADVLATAIAQARASLAGVEVA
ncbi:MAG: DsbA family oxidoreductase [Roseiarcus sp.]|jgi:predicted DsbA family dithiol-disulfide isomerase